MMKKNLYFLPAVLALCAYAVLAYTSGFKALDPWVWVCIAMMFLSAVIMAFGKWHGAICGFVVGVVVIYMSTQYTGQVIDIELPLGLILCVFYLTCGVVTYNRHK